MTTHGDIYATGSCGCKSIKFQLQQRPLTVHCCHCTWCQRETGSAFVLNAVIEAKYMQTTPDSALEPKPFKVPSSSGSGQTVFRCPTCFVALWSIYGDETPMLYVRAGTLDDPNLTPPEIHIFTSSKQKWLTLPEGVPAVPEYYDSKQYWRPESLERLQTLMRDEKQD